MTSDRPYRYFLPALVLSLHLGCAASPNVLTTESELTAMNDITQKQAVEISSKVIADAGWRLADYAVTVTEKVDAWHVRFQHHPPSPPGAEAMVEVRKQDGSTKVNWGE